MSTQNSTPTLPGFQFIRQCVQYPNFHPLKPIFYPSNYDDVSDFIILTWSENQVEYYTTRNCLEFHQIMDHAIVINIRRSVLGINHTLLGVAVYCKVQIQTAIDSDSIDGEIIYMY